MLKGTSVKFRIKRQLIPVLTEIDACLVVRMVAILLTCVAILPREYSSARKIISASLSRRRTHGITPLQNEKQVIQDAVNALTSPRGVTNIPAGLGWAWRVLKPPTPFTEAIPDPDYDREQAIVLLTDGQNYGGSGDGYKGTFGLGGAARPDMNDRLLQVADAIKSDGVIIYVIQFAFADSALQTLLQTAASGPGSPFYYFAPDAATLQQVFREVANHLSELRLSK